MNKESREMMAVWPDIVRDFTEMIKDLDITTDVATWMDKALQHNVTGGKKIRGLTFIQAYKSLVPKDQLTEGNIYLARILAWCMELMQFFFIVIDNIVDQSLIRRDQSCWFKYDAEGDEDGNDGVLFETIVYYILRKYCDKRECYVDLIEAFQDTIFTTILGESLELISTNFDKKPNLDLFTMDRYNSISTNKTAHYTYVLPVIAAMHLAGIKDQEMFNQAKTILLEIGQLFQIQNDYLNIFGDSELIGKDSTDIQRGKCTWLIVTALQCATPKQREILEECYGVSDPEKVRRVKQLFIDLDLPDAYSKYEEKMYNQLNTKIQQISCHLPRDLFHDLLEKIFRRIS